MVMLPGDKPVEGRYNDYLARADVNLADNPRLHNARELGAWIEWLKHPERHDGTRVVIAPNGSRQESYGNLPNPDNPPPPGYYIDDSDPGMLPDPNGVRDGEQYYCRYESVIEGWYFSQFFGPQTAVSTQHVERAEAPFAGATAVLTEIVWRVDDFNNRLLATPDTIGAWNGTAGKQYGESVAAMCDLTTKMQEIADGLIPRIAEYCALIKSTREALNQSTGKTIEEFKKKIPEPGDPAEVFKWITGLAFDTASASGKELTNGTKDPLSSTVKTNLVSTLWDSVMGVLLGLITAASTPHPAPPTWAEIAEAHLDNQGKILADATARMRDLATAVADLKTQLDQAHIPDLPKP